MVSPRTRMAVSGLGVLTLVVMITACGAGRVTDPAAPPASDAATGGAAPRSQPAPGVITVGTTDKVVALDPAGSYDQGSSLVQLQIYQFLMSIPIGGQIPEPDAARSCDFDDANRYTCILREGLTFSNGDPLTSEDVRFSFQRILDIADPNGPGSLLANVSSISAPDPTTVSFTLNTPNDQTFPFVLGTAAGPIVNSRVFPADSLLSDEDVVGSGPYRLGSYRKNQLVELIANERYLGNGGPIRNSRVLLQSFTDASNLLLAIRNGDVDVAWRSLDAPSVESLTDDPGVQVEEGPGGEIRYIVFNLRTQPGDNEEARRAIRRAVAMIVDRPAIAEKIYHGTYVPLYSMVPDGLPGHVDAMVEEFGPVPDPAAAAAELAAVGVPVPVRLSLQYSPDHYGPSSDLEYNEIKRQLEATGLFEVGLQATEWVQYSKNRIDDVFPAYQLGWFPDFPDADNYLAPFLVMGNFLGAHYCDVGVTERPCDLDGVLPLLAAEQSQPDEERLETIELIQRATASGTLPTIPLLQGKQIAVVRTGTTGVRDTLDTTFHFRFWVIGVAP